MDSTQAIIRLWRLCVPTGAGPEAGGDGALPLETLKAVLVRELEDKLDYLDGESVDDILWRYMTPDENGIVGFLQFWRGMEEILCTCRVHRQNLSVAQLHAIIGFRYLRTCVLEMALGDASQERSVFRVSELRYFMRQTTIVAGPQGATFWERQAQELPEDSMLVTGEEVASALLSWLEDLVWNDVEHAGGVPLITPSTALPSTTRVSNDSHWSESGDEEGTAQETDSSSSSSPREINPTKSLGALVQTAGVAGGGSFALKEMGDVGDHCVVPQQTQQHQPALTWGQVSSMPYRAMSPSKQHGLNPQGPATSRSVINRRGSQRPSLAEGPPYSWSEKEWATDGSARGHSLFEATLVSFMDRFEKRPPIHRAQAHMWRDAVEFQCELRRRLAEAPVLSFADFHRCAREHLSITVGRRRKGSPSPRMRTAIYVRWGPTLLPILRKIVSRRLACGWQVLLNGRRGCRRSGLVSSSACAGSSHPTILQRLLADQCRTAVILEKNVNFSSRAGSLAFCLARMFRAALRGACSLWQHMVFEGPQLPLAWPILPAPLVSSASPKAALSLAGSPFTGLPPSVSPTNLVLSGSQSIIPTISLQVSPGAGSSPPVRPPPARSSSGTFSKNLVRSPPARGDSTRGSPIPARGSPTASAPTPSRQAGRGTAAGGSTPTLGGICRRVSADSPQMTRGRGQLNSGAGAGRGRGVVGPRSPPPGTSTTPSASPAVRTRAVPTTPL